MSHAWYVRRDGNPRGPYSWEELAQQARSGAIGPGDEVWNEGMSGWTRADQIPGLAPIAASAGTPPPPPAGTPPPSPPPPVASPMETGVGRRGGVTGAPRWVLVAALIAAVFLGAGGCGAAYLLFFRDRGVPAAPAETELPPSPSATPSAVGDLTEPSEPSAAPLTPTAPATAVFRPVPASPTAEPRTETPTAEPQTETPTAEPQTETPTAEPQTETPTAEPPTETPTQTSVPASPTEPAEGSDATPPGLPAPQAVVEAFIQVTLGTVPGAAVDYDRARVLMTVAYAAEFDTPSFVPLAYGIQEGPTGYEIAAQEISGSTATVLVLGYWEGNLGRQWQFLLQEEAGLWRVDGIQALDATEATGGGAQSAFWQLNPVVTEFTVYPHGGWELVLTFDPPAQDIEADFRIEYRRQDDGSLATAQEVRGIIGAGRVRLTLDSDWTGYDLGQLGFRPGAHRAVAFIDGVEIAAGELVVE